MKWYRYIREAYSAILRKGNFKNSAKSRSTKYLDKKLTVLSKKVASGNYKFSSWIPTSQPKKDGGRRIIIIPSFYDRVVLRALATYLSEKLSSKFDEVEDVSYAYQKDKGVREALIHLKSLSNPDSVILKVDIKKFFDNIDKDIVLNLLKKNKIDEVAYSLICESLSPKLNKNEYFEEAQLQIKNGIPQGNAISAILSNLMLLDLDMQSKSNNLKMIRYADDIVFVCKDMQEAQSTLCWAENYLRNQRNLEIHPISFEPNAKTSIISSLRKDKLKYLGIEFDGEHLSPTKECQERFISRINTVSRLDNITTEEKITEIKTIINQWCGYYAFTDITNNRLKTLSKKINQACSYIFKDEWNKVDLIQKVYKFRRRQERKGLKKLLKPVSFGENYNWLMVYE